MGLRTHYIRSLPHEEIEHHYLLSGCQARVMEEDGTCVSAVLVVCGHYFAVRTEPRLLLQGFARSAKALPDDFGCLGPKQCHIVRAGEVFTGKAWAISTIIVSSFVILPYCGSKVAVWRYPIMLPSDVDVWEAVPLPACADFVCRNCVYCSVQAGFVAVSRFAFESSACRSTTQGL